MSDTMSKSELASIFDETPPKYLRSSRVKKPSKPLSRKWAVDDTFKSLNRDMDKLSGFQQFKFFVQRYQFGLVSVGFGVSFTWAILSNI